MPIDVKKRYLDPADVAITWIPIRLFFVEFRSTSLQAANVSGLVFALTNTNLKHSIFWGTIIVQTWQIEENFVQIATVEKKL
jgi:hypothetical protein